MAEHEAEVVAALAASTICAATLVALSTLFHKAVAVSESNIAKKRSRRGRKFRHRTAFEDCHKYLNENEFCRAFKMNRRSFVKLLSNLRTDLSKDEDMASNSSGGAVSPEVRLAITLRLLSGASHQDLIVLFRLGKSTIYDVFRCTVAVINKRLSFRELPLGDEEALSEIADGFAHFRVALSPLWGCFGALDGIDINIKSPKTSINHAITTLERVFTQSLFKKLSILAAGSCIPLHYA